MATIAGRVIDSDTNEPVLNAKIVAINQTPTGRRINYNAGNLGDGFYEIRNLPPSLFIVQATADGYRADRGGTRVIDLTNADNAPGINILLIPIRPKTRQVNVTVDSSPPAARGARFLVGNVRGNTTKGMQVAIGNNRPLEINTPPNFIFRNWTATGGLNVINPYSDVTTVNIGGDGTLTANFDAIPLTAPRTAGLPPEIDVGQRPHPELGDERVWKQRTGNIPGEKLQTEVSGPAGGRIPLDIGGRTEAEPIHLRVQKADEEGKGQVQVIVHEEGDLAARIKDASVTVLQTGQHDTTDDNGVAIFTVPANSTYSVQVDHEDYRRNVGRSGFVTTTAAQIVRVPLSRENFGRITGIVADEEGKPVPNVRIDITGPPLPAGLTSPHTAATGRFDFRNLQPGIYKLKASHRDYEEVQDQSSKEIDLEAGKREPVRLRLKKKEGLKKKVGKGIPFLRRKWWTGKEEGEEKGKNQFVRLGIAIGLTLFLYFVFYQPFFSATGQNHPIFRYVIPFILTPLILWFFIVPRFMEKPNWGPLILAAIFSLATLFTLLLVPQVPDFLKARYFLFGIPLGLFLFIYSMAGRKDQGMGKTLLLTAGTLAIIGFLIIGINMIKSGKAFEIETYLKTLDVLKLVGVPSDTVEGMKSGVRNTLSFLQFKGAQPTKPEAKKIGGFEAIQLKFGSTHNNFQLPTLFARMDYILPVTVTNPNKFDTKLVVENFNIEDIFLNNKSDQRILCGSTGEPPTGKIELGNINPEEEKVTTIDFKGKTTQNNGVPFITPAVGSSVECKEVLKYKSSPPTNPMFPARVDINAKREDCTTANKDTVCKPIADNLQRVYTIPFSAFTVADARAKSDTVCECKINRNFNIMDELCFMDDNKAKITLRSSYDFKVQGKGELILVKTETDRKLAPKPTITSSAGPLTVTTYFVSDVHIPGKTTTSTMFIQITNDGDGSATLDRLKIKDVLFIGKTGETTQNQVALSDVVNMNNCQPKSNILIGKDGATLSCPVSVEKDKAKYESKVTGTYLTVPVIVDVDYTYTQTHSTAINVKKESIPPELIEQGEQDKVDELKRQFEPLPYYCPGELKIYDPEVTSSTAQTTQTSQPSKFANFCQNKISKGLGKCVNSEGECKSDNECAAGAGGASGSETLKCRDVGAEVKICCWSGSTDQQCKKDFETWKATQ